MMKQGSLHNLSTEIDQAYQLFYETDDFYLAEAYYDNIQRLNHIYEAASGDYYLNEGMIDYLDNSIKGIEVRELGELQDEIAIEEYQKQSKFTSKLFHEMITSISESITEKESSNIIYLSKLSAKEKYKIITDFYTKTENKKGFSLFHTLNFYEKLYFGNEKKTCIVFPSYENQHSSVMIGKNKKALTEIAYLIYGIGFLESGYDLMKDNEFAELYQYNKYNLYKRVIPLTRFKQFINYMQEENLHPALATSMNKRLTTQGHNAFCKARNGAYISANTLIHMKQGDLSEFEYQRINEMNQKIYDTNQYTKEYYQNFDFISVLQNATAELLSQTIIYHDQTKKRSIQESFHVLESLPKETSLKETCEKLDVNVNENIKVMKQILKKPKIKRMLK